MVNFRPLSLCCLEGLQFCCAVATWYVVIFDLLFFSLSLSSPLPKSSFPLICKHSGNIFRDLDYTLYLPFHRWRQKETTTHSRSLHLPGHETKPLVTRGRGLTGYDSSPTNPYLPRGEPGNYATWMFVQSVEGHEGQPNWGYGKAEMYQGGTHNRPW